MFMKLPFVIDAKTSERRASSRAGSTSDMPGFKYVSREAAIAATSSGSQSESDILVARGESAPVSKVTGRRTSQDRVGCV